MRANCNAAADLRISDTASMKLLKSRILTAGGGIWTATFAMRWNPPQENTGVGKLCCVDDGATQHSEQRRAG